MQYLVKEKLKSRRKAVRVNKENVFWIKGYLIFAGFPENEETEANWKLILPEAYLIIKCPLAFFFFFFKFGISICSTSVTCCSFRSSRIYSFNREILDPNVVKICVELACLPLSLNYKQTVRNIIIFKLQYWKEKEHHN